MHHIIINFKTMGRAADAAVVQVGLIILNNLTIVEEEEITIDLESAVAAGGCLEAEAVKLWLQSDSKEVFGVPTVSHASAVKEIMHVIKEYDARGEVTLWGNTVHFKETLSFFIGHNVSEIYNIGDTRTVTRLVQPDNEKLSTNSALEQAHHIARFLIKAQQ